MLHFHMIYIGSVYLIYAHLQVLAGRRVFVQYCQYSPESDAVREMLRIKAYVNPYPKKNNPSREADEKMAAGILK